MVGAVPGIGALITLNMSLAAGVSFCGKNGKFVDEVKLSVSGDHNIMNALAACVVADRLEVPFP